LASLDYAYNTRIVCIYFQDAAHALFPEQPAAIAAAIRKRTVQQMEDDLAKLSMCAAKVRTRDEWSRHPQGEFLATTPPVSIEQIGSAERKHPLPPAKARALEGVRVLSLTHVLAGPTVGSLLGEHGTDVIELRNPYFQYVIPL